MIAARPLNKTFYFHFPNCTFEWIFQQFRHQLYYPSVNSSLIVGYVRRHWVRRSEETIDRFRSFFYVSLPILFPFFVHFLSRTWNDTWRNSSLSLLPRTQLCVYMWNKKFMYRSLTTVNFWYSKTIFHFSVFMSKLFMIKKEKKENLQ